jgi:hypothetical protein
MGNTDSVIWSANTHDRPRHFDAYAQATGGGALYKMNAGGTVGFAGSVNGDTGEAIYQQITDSSDLYLYDLTSHTRAAAPAAVNTSQWESSPSVSPGFMLFNREARRWRVVLYDRNTGTSTVLANVSYRCRCVFAGQVTDDYATWTDCSGTRCQIWYLDIAGSSVHRFPNPLGKYQYASGVSSGTGDIYVARSAPACGANVRIVRWNPVAGGDPVVVSSLPDGYDVADELLTFADTGGHDDVYFGEFLCGYALSDLYVLADADTVTPRLAASTTASRRPVTGIKRVDGGPADLPA